MKIGAVVLAGLLLVAACGGGDDGEARVPPASTPVGADSQPGGGDAESTDVCGLLSDEEIAGAAASPVTGRSAAGDGRCEWTVEREDISAVTLHVHLFDSVLLYTSGRDLPNAEPVAGLGDDAFVGVGFAVNVLVGEKAYFTQITPSCGLGTTFDCEPLNVEAVAGATELARLVAPRL